MSNQTITVTIKEEETQSTDSSYSPSQSCSSESYTSYESSSLETPSESQYSIANSEDCSGSSDLPSSYYTDSSQ